MADLKIVVLKIEHIQPRDGNPRTHSKKQIEQIARSIKRFGFTNPVLIDEKSSIIAGHGRFAAAQFLGMTEVPTIRLSGMSEAEIRAYVIADNKLAEKAGWSPQLLKLEFEYLSDLGFDFDLTITGFDIPEIDALLQADQNAEGLDPLDQLPPLSEEPPVSRLGDVWQIDRHRLICGDATLEETYTALMDGAEAGAAFADPPYNVPIAGHVSGLGKTQHREFAMGVGEMNSDQFTAFLAAVFVNMVKVSRAGAIHFQCMDWRHAREMIAAGEAMYSELKNICVWAKNNGGMGSLYRSAHELVFVWKAGRGPHINNVELGKNGRYRTNVWTYPGANSFGATRDEDLANHPTVKPVAMVMDALLDCSHRGDIVLDPFAGSGTTLIAAHRTGRHGYGVEIDPTYCDLIVRRLSKAAKSTAILAGDGRTFAEVASARADEAQEAAA